MSPPDKTKTLHLCHKLLYYAFSGLQKTFYFFGEEVGAAIFGIIFHALGTRATLFTFAAFFAMLLAILLLHLRFSEHVREYEKLPPEDVDKDDNCTSASGDNSDD